MRSSAPRVVLRVFVPRLVRTISFSANWICRGGYVVVMVPNAELVLTLFGNAEVRVVQDVEELTPELEPDPSRG